MGKARNGVDLVVGAVVVVVIAWVALKAVGFVFSALMFGVKLLIAIAVVGVGLKALDMVLSRRELRSAGGRQLNR